jgi:L-ascorbate metabolism protein UlaG (beta-lactamase superfamily)
MFAPKGAIPSLKYMTKQRRKNPLVELPEISKELLSKVTHCLITHCQKGHFDHLDRAGSKWLKENNIPVFCSLQDAKFISNKGINVSILDENVKNDFLNGSIDLIPCLHGKGLIGKLMAHGFGYYIQLKNEPSLYITGDTRLTSEISGFIMDKQPENIVLPAGGARFDLGDDIIMDIEEALKVAEISKGNIIANHLEALDHCPVTRSDLNKSVKIQNLEKRFFIPQDGESIIL